jgi:hypothetical protein
MEVGVLQTIKEVTAGARPNMSLREAQAQQELMTIKTSLKYRAVTTDEQRKCTTGSIR